MTISDTDRAIQHDPARAWPEEVRIEVVWKDGDHTKIRREVIEPDRFFGSGRFGAPMEGAALIGMVERMVREGIPRSAPTPPPWPPRIKARKNARKKR